MKIHYAGQIGGPFGWGVFGENITQELSKAYELCGPDNADVVLMPLNNPDLSPMTSAQGKINLGICFFESPLAPKAKENAAKLDIVFVGSSWCQERCAEAGIYNTRVLIQGVDSAIFSPQPPRKPDGQFRIFSGGKFEYRKGQDLVIAAFKEFSKTHPEAHLVCSWFNPWLTLMAPTFAPMELEWPPPDAPNQKAWFENLLLSNSVPHERFTILPQLSQHQLAYAMANTDCGLFPNRCEGGTNLVLMEYASLGREVIANALTGHADVLNGISCEIPAREDENRWALQSVRDIVAAIEDTQKYPWPFVPPVQRWTWGNSAKTIVNALTELAAGTTLAARE